MLLSTKFILQKQSYFRWKSSSCRMFNKQKFGKCLMVIVSLGAVFLCKRKSLNKLPQWKLFFIALFVNNFLKQTSDNPVHPYENFTCHFTCKKHMELERFYIRSRYFFTYEIRKSHVKWTGSKLYMCNLGVRNMHFTNEIKHSHTKINITYQIFISHKELKHWNLMHYRSASR